MYIHPDHRPPLPLPARAGTHAPPLRGPAVIVAQVPDDNGTDTRGTPATDVLTRIDRPRMFKCLFHNDDYTSMEFVTEVLMTVFRRSRVEAHRIMLSIHNGGRGVAGVYTKDIAETKAAAAVEKARSRGYPLLVTTEPD